MITAYDPPGFMTDFDRIPGQRAQWSRAVSGWFDECVAAEKRDLGGQPCQYYNQLTTHPSGQALEQEIVWNALPGVLRNRWGRAHALAIADHPLPLTQRMDRLGSYFYGGQWEHLYYRPQDEYCEWRVTRDPDGGIRRVTFTSEPPEYWQALHGDTLPNLNGDPAYPTTGDPDLLLALYQEYVSPKVRYEDLICAVDLVDLSDPGNPFVVYPKGSYNPYNRWNTTDGIMHLTQPSNSLSAEILLGADATVLRAAGPDGRIVSDPDALVCCAQYGGANRCSDPTIGASVNELAALGFAITLRNPVGLYMNDLNVTGWAGPDGKPVDPAWFRILRGRPGLIERAVFEVPKRAGFRVSDITIGGVPISVGGQLSEHMTVKLVGLASEPGKFANKPTGCAGGCCADAANPAFLHYRRVGDPCRPGQVPAFDYLSQPVAVPTPTVRTGPAPDGPRRTRYPVHRSRGDLAPVAPARNSTMSTAIYTKSKTMITLRSNVSAVSSSNWGQQMTEQPGVSRRHLLISGGLVATAPLLGAPRRAPIPAEPIVDVPGIHNFFMFGRKTLYVEHMPMFTEEMHMYQVILRVALPDALMRDYRARQGPRRTPWNLVNSAQMYTLPQVKAGTLSSFLVDVYTDYSNANAAPAGKPFAREVPLTVREVVHFRHFDFNIPRPQHPTYLLFGRGGEAHLSHYIARDPDFQHIVTLRSAPAWLSRDQLAAGVEVCLTDVLSQPVPCANPLREQSYRVLFQGRPDARAALDLSGATSVWFSTGNLLNAKNPC